jgi:hypothetical protein
VGVSVEVPPVILERLRGVCLALPEAYEEQAWIGARWRVRGRTFAHVLTIADSWPLAYARAAGTDGPATVLTFRSSGPELDALGHVGPPFFRPPWRADEVGMLIAAGSGGSEIDRSEIDRSEIDWDEIGELLVESYCLLAPRTLIDLVDRPTR